MSRAFVEAPAGPHVELYAQTVPSPLGRITFVADAQALCGLDFVDCEVRLTQLLSRRFGDVVLRREGDPLGIGEKIADYFAGDVHALDAVPVNPGGTEFQRTVWSVLRSIPAGSTRSYAEVAAAIGRPAAPRAVGGANARNPVAIVIPCHRLVGSNAALTGYAGGLERKRWLLRHEGARRSAPSHLKPSQRLQEAIHGNQGW